MRTFPAWLLHLGTRKLLNMKIKPILTALAFAVASISFAQSDQAVSSEDLKKEALELTEQMTAVLDLNEAQVERMKGLNMSIMKKKAELKGMDLSDAEMTKKIAAYEERHQSTVKQVLNDEQYKKFEEKYGDVKVMKKEKAKK